MKIKLSGQNGQVKFDKPLYNLNMQLVNGRIEISPDSSEKYHYNLSVTNGSIDDFLNSDSPDAYNIDISLVNGTIRKE